MVNLTLLSWRELAEYHYRRFKFAYNGRRKWRKEAKEYKRMWWNMTGDVMRAEYKAILGEEKFEDADLRRIGWKTLTTVLLAVIALLLLK